MKSKLRRINIAILVDVLESITGGAERQIYELIRQSDKNRFKVHLFVLHNKDIPAEIRSLDVDSRCLGIRKVYAIKGILQGFKFISFLKKEKIDILMTVHFGADLWGTIFGKLARTPVIISNRRDEGFWRKKIHILVYKLINRWVTKIIVVSSAVRRMVLEEENVNKNKIELISNGVDLKRLRANTEVLFKKKELKLPLDCKVIGCIGILKPIKGHKFLIKAAQGVIRQFPDIHFIFAGEDEMEGALAAQSKELGLERNIHFLGVRNDIADLINIMDICVLPSLSEGLSNVLLEYMAMKKPVIATNVGGNIDVIEHEKNGILIPANDPDSLKHQIIKLLENNDFAQALAAKARQVVEEKFNLDNQMKYLETFLTGLARKNSNGIQAKNDNIMHLISSSGLFGAEKVMLSLASNMNKGKVTQYVVAVKNEHNPHDEVIKAAERKNIPTFTIESKGRFDFWVVTALSDFIRNNNIKVLYTHNYKANFLGLLAAKRTGVAIVAVLHGYIGRGRKLRLYEMFDRWLLRFFNKVVLVDKSLKKYFNGMNGKVTVINNGVRVSGVAEKRSEFNTQYSILNTIVIGTVGRLSAEKGHKYLIEAFAKLIKDGHNVRLLIVGDGDLRGALEQLAVSLGIREKVEFTGFQEDVAPFYSAMDIYVSSSLVEHFPLSILEAMSFSKPIVASNAGGTSDLIKAEETGMLINPGSSEEIYEALLRYVQNPDLMKKCAEGARKLVNDKYSLENMVNSYNEIYENIAQKS